jgi:hypothetical protein
MADLAIPFSVSDILERVIPGACLMTSATVVFHDHLPVSKLISSSPFAYAAFLAGAYALGVALNSLGGYMRIRGYRQYWSSAPSEMEQAVHKAIHEHFGIHPDENSWRLCYGTVIKHGYGSNTQLFLGLDIFCRAMAVTSALAAVVFLFALSLALRSSANVFPWAICCATAFALAWLFWRGMRNYSQAFVGSIYEGFLSWLCDERLKSQTNSSPDQSGNIRSSSQR